MVCLIMAIVLHAALIFLVPLMPNFNGGSVSVDPEANQEAGVDSVIDSVSFSSFDPEMEFDDTAGKSEVAAIAPLPVS